MACFVFNASEVILKGFFDAVLDKLHTDVHGSEELFLIKTKHMHSLTQRMLCCLYLNPLTQPLMAIIICIPKQYYL